MLNSTWNCVSCALLKLLISYLIVRPSSGDSTRHTQMTLQCQPITYQI
uniref:Uncharacterized protein n=1 Tax=Arundo donax TaxID=35708 RepID=A0A0A9FE33_ARUDO